MADKYSSKGTELQREIASVMTPVASCLSLKGPGAEVQFWDGTALDSDDIEDGELADMVAPGEMSGQIFYDPADAVHSLFGDDLAARGQYINWQLVCPDTGASVITFNGSTKTFETSAAVKDGFKGDFAIKLRTPPVYP